MTLIIEGEPVAKSRPKFTRNGHAYTPAKTRCQENLIRETYLRSGFSPLNGAIEAKITFVYEPPKSLSRKKRSELLGKPKLTRPDNDNLVKLVLDALNGAAYDDDNQVYKVISQKIYGSDASTIIELREEAKTND